LSSLVQNFLPMSFFLSPDAVDSLFMARRRIRKSIKCAVFGVSCGSTSWPVKVLFNLWCSLTTFSVTRPKRWLQLFMSGLAKPVNRWTGDSPTVHLRKETGPAPSNDLWCSEHQAVDKVRNKANKRLLFLFKLYLSCKYGRLLNWSINSVSLFTNIKEIFQRVLRHHFEFISH
jgi:hypothetical protein